MSKIAFAAIIKGSDSEADVLNNLLWTVQPHVDGIFITITQPNEKVKQVAELYNATVSHFEWCNDFAKARNYNFAQVPKDYDYILWGDADDEFKNLALLKPFVEKNKAAFFNGTANWSVIHTDLKVFSFIREFRILCVTVKNRPVIESHIVVINV
jgi:hypothetical protein